MFCSVAPDFCLNTEICQVSTGHKDCNVDVQGPILFIFFLILRLFWLE